jgi:hypothetical protein
MSANIEGGATIWARQTIESDVFYNKPDKWFKIWFYLVNRVAFQDTKRHKRGELFLKYEWICDATGATPNQVDSFIRWAKSTEMLTTQKTTRGMILKIAKYSHYQTLDNYYSDVKTDTENEVEPKQNRNRTDTILKNGNNGKKQKKRTLATFATTSVAVEVVDPINKILEMFQMNINPTINYGNKTQRKAVQELIDFMGETKLVHTIQYYISIKDEPFTPVITTPYQLKEKLAQLVKHHDNKKSQIVTIS